MILGRSLELDALEKKNVILKNEKLWNYWSTYLSFNATSHKAGWNDFRLHTWFIQNLDLIKYGWLW